MLLMVVAASAYEGQIIVLQRRSGLSLDRYEGSNLDRNGDVGLLIVGERKTELALRTSLQREERSERRSNAKNQLNQTSPLVCPRINTKKPRASCRPNWHSEEFGEQIAQRLLAQELVAAALRLADAADDVEMLARRHRPRGPHGPLGVSARRSAIEHGTS